MAAKALMLLLAVVLFVLAFTFLNLAVVNARSPKGLAYCALALVAMAAMVCIGKILGI